MRAKPACRNVALPTPRESKKNEILAHPRCALLPPLSSSPPYHPQGVVAAARPAARKPDLDKANTNYAKAVELLGEFKHLGKALQLIGEAIAVRPKIAMWYATRAQIYRGLGRNQLAFYDYNAAIRIEPRMWQYYLGRALCLRKLRRFGDALADVETAMAGDPACSAYRFYRGTVYMHMEDYASASAVVPRAE